MKTKLFELSGKMRFEAKDIDDAFRKLSQHFKSLADGGDGIELLDKSDVTIATIEIELKIK